MNISFIKIATISAITLGSLCANATIITGGLSYDDTGTHLITGTNGLTYLGWSQTANFDYNQTVNATQKGGLYEDYRIANEFEAGEFFSWVTGSGAPDSEYDYHKNKSYTTDATGNINPFGGASTEFTVYFFLEGKSNDSYIGYLSADGSANRMTMDNEPSGYFSPVKSSETAWLLVSGQHNGNFAVPEPTTTLILSLGLLGLGVARKQKKV